MRWSQTAEMKPNVLLDGDSAWWGSTMFRFHELLAEPEEVTFDEVWRHQNGFLTSMEVSKQGCYLFEGTLYVHIVFNTAYWWHCWDCLKLIEQDSSGRSTDCTATNQEEIKAAVVAADIAALGAVQIKVRTHAVWWCGYLLPSSCHTSALSKRKPHVLRLNHPVVSIQSHILRTWLLLVACASSQSIQKCKSHWQKESVLLVPVQGTQATACHLKLFTEITVTKRSKPPLEVVTRLDDLESDARDITDLK